MNTKITFLLALINGANLRPSTRSDQLGNTPSTRGHGFICSTGNERSQLGITYDKKGRYYSISYHNVCPNPEMKDWKCNADYKQCKNGTTYHCARDSITGQFTDACALPVFCGRGKEPLIQFPEGIPRIICRLCENNHFNDVNKSSDTYSVCYEKMACRKYEEIECEVAMGNASYWTQRRCKCNWKLDFIPIDLETRKPGDNFCVEDARCDRYECKSTLEGKRQERLSDYSCVPVCDPGSQRINESTDCVSTESENTTVAVHKVTKESAITLWKTNSTKLTTETTTSLSKTAATTDQISNSRITKAPASATQEYSMIVIGVVIGIVVAVIGGFAFKCYKNKRVKTRKNNQKKSNNIHNTNPPGKPECDSRTTNSIKLKWDEPPEAHEAGDNERYCFIGKYVIERREDGHGNWERVRMSPCNSCTITDLGQGTSYQFQVATFHNGNTGTFSLCSDLMRTQQPAIAPEICTRPIDVIALKGTAFTNRVKYKGRPVPEVIWKKGDVVLEEIQDRLMFEKNEVLEECTMEVKSAERNDSGNYKVILRNEIDQCEKSFQIIVKDVPGKPVGPLSVICLAESETNKYQLAWKPPEDNGGSEIYNYIVEEKSDTVEWHTYLDNVRGTSCTFDLDRLRKTYNFRVMAENKQGFSEPCEMEKPFVLIAPKMGTDKVKDYVTKEGSLCRIEIPYESVPKPHAYWTKNGRRFEQEDGRVYLKNGNGTITLELNPVVKNDTGKYRVKLTNLLGHNETSFNIQIKYKPGKPEGPLEVKQIKTKEYRLEWRPPMDTGGSEIKMYIVEKRDPTGRWVECTSTSCTFCITDERNDLFFRVKAENEQGIGDSLEMDKPFVTASDVSAIENDGNVQQGKPHSKTAAADDVRRKRRYSAPPDRTRQTDRLMSSRIENTVNYRDICVSGKEAGTLPQPVFSVANEPVLKDDLAEPCNKKDNADAKNISIAMGSTILSGKISGSFQLQNEEETLSYNQKKPFRLPSSGTARQESDRGKCLDISARMPEIHNEYKQDPDEDETFKSLQK